MWGLLLLLVTGSLGQESSHDRKPTDSPASPTRICWTESSGELGVLAAGSNAWLVLDPRTGEINRRSPLPANFPRTALFACDAARDRTFVVDPWQSRVLLFEHLPGHPGFRLDTKWLPFPCGPRVRDIVLASNGEFLVLACDDPLAAGRGVLKIDLGDRTPSKQFLPRASNVRGLALSPKGDFALVAHLVPKDHLPATQIQQGWVFTNAVSLVPLSSMAPVVTFSLDLRTQAWADPAAVVISPDGLRAYVAHAGANTVTAIDLARMHAFARERQSTVKIPLDSKPPETTFSSVPHSSTSPYSDSVLDDPRVTRKYIVKRWDVGLEPRHLAISPDGQSLAVANHLGDSISLIDLSEKSPIRTLALDAIPDTPARLGERLFVSGRLSFGGQFSCASCHLDGHADGLNWDLPADGIANFQNTKSLLGASGTAPYGWQGASPTLGDRFVGTLKSLFQHQTTEAEAAALTAYLEQLNYPEHVRSRETTSATNSEQEVSTQQARLRGGELFRGKAGCGECHRGPRRTDGKLHDLGLETPAKAFDTPSLEQVRESAPYLHDGRAASLESLFQDHDPRGLHGSASELSPAELRDLLTYLRSL